jgi:uncharacterized protein (DUF1684 family)
MRLCLLALALPLLAVGPMTNYVQEVAKFRADREKSLISPDGWTTVVGLTWLKEGENQVTLPDSTPVNVGTFTLKAGHVQFHPASGVKLPTQELKEDAAPLVFGSMKFLMIQRGDKFGIRVKDSEAKARKEFTHLSWYPVDPSWRIVAKYTPWDSPHTLSFDTVIPGLKEEDKSPGYVTFTRDGREYRLEPSLDQKELSFVFRDQTSGKSTYAASRFLDTDAPANLRAPGTVILDFNQAYNPPCAFTAYATCPLAPPQNRLSLPILAGELMYNGHH